MVCDWLLWLRCHLKSCPPVALPGIFKSGLRLAYPFSCWWTLGCFQFLWLCDAAAWVYDLYGHMFLFLVGGYLGIELLGHMETLCLTFQKLPKSLYRFMFHQEFRRGGFFWFTMRIMVAPPATWGVRVLPEATMKKQNKTLCCPNKTSLASFSPWLPIWTPYFGKLESVTSLQQDFFKKKVEQNLKTVAWEKV